MCNEDVCCCLCPSALPYVDVHESIGILHCWQRADFYQKRISYFFYFQSRTLYHSGEQIVHGCMPHVQRFPDTSKICCVAVQCKVLTLRGTASSPAVLQCTAYTQSISCCRLFNQHGAWEARCFRAATLCAEPFHHVRVAGNRGRHPACWRCLLAMAPTSLILWCCLISSGPNAPDALAR